MEASTLVALTVLAGAMASLMGTVLAPIVLMWLTSRERRREKLEDYARQDAVAASTEKVRARLLTTQAAAVEQAVSTNHKLDEIHTAVNSNLTKATEGAIEAKEGELQAKEQMLILMVEIMDLRRAAGVAPSYDVLDAIEAAKKRILELKAALAPPGHPL